MKEINSLAHTAARTNRYLNDQNMKIIGRLPYSPDLATNDVFLFSRVRGLRFLSAEGAVDAFGKEINKLRPENWRTCFQE